MMVSKKDFEARSQTGQVVERTIENFGKVRLLVPNGKITMDLVGKYTDTDGNVNQSDMISELLSLMIVDDKDKPMLTPSEIDKLESGLYFKLSTLAVDLTGLNKYQAKN
jgi:hypothetical protein